MAGSKVGVALAALSKRFPDKLSRLRGGFYDITDKDGSVVPFVLNDDQECFLAERHGRDLILKARQKGFTTVIQLDMLDDCLFMPNLTAGVIAHNLKDAQSFFRDKIRFAYDRLPAAFQKAVRATQDAADSLRFSNGSSIRVGTSLRSGTLQRLHISEYGKLCAKTPDKAREVKAGAFNTVQVGQTIVVESTAEGHAGHFYDMVKQARDLERMGKELTKLDFKFHFYPWFTSPEYRLGGDVGESAEMIEYFARIEAETGFSFTRQQRAWYIKTAEVQQEDMKREFPSTADEAFEASVEGAYFSKQMAKMREDGRICRIPVEDLPVETSWDIGVGDSTAITFWQTVGLERRVVDYYETSGEGWGHYAKVLTERGYHYREHFMPHDAAKRIMGQSIETAAELAERAGIRPITIVPRIAREQDGIDATRAFLPRVRINENRCARLIECLDSYRKEWDDRLGVWKDKPRHDEFSHGYKSLETFTVANPLPSFSTAPRLPKRSLAWVA